MKAKDYVIVQEKNTKPFLMCVQSVDDKTLSGVLEHNRRKDYKVVEVRKKDVIVNLGPNPTPGKVYNIDVSNLYRKTIEHDFWGPLHFYVKLDDVTLKMLRNALDRTAKVIQQHKLESFVEKSETEIRSKKGKYAGMFHFNPKGTSVTWYAPEWAQNQADMMDYIILHEFGHNVRYNGVTSLSLRAKWLRLFQTSISPVVIPHKGLQAIWNKMLEEKVNDDEVKFSEALKNVAATDEKYEKAVKVLLQWLRQVQHITPKELSIAWDAGDQEYLESVWPTSAIDSSDLSPVISEYATKNVEETFAEAFAFYLSGKKLPKSVNDLIEKSLSYARKVGG